MQNTLRGKDILSIDDLSPAEMEMVVERALRLKEKPPFDPLRGMVVACCFFEPSTRTRLSFETAVLRLGGHVIGFADSSNTSMKKGETLQDTARIISNYADAIVMRHPVNGSVDVVAQYASVPVINAGDGTNQHPSQTLLDLVTIKETQGRLDGIKIAMVGDLRYGRTVHSLTRALSHFGATFYYVSPQSLSMPQELLDKLDRDGLRYEQTTDLESALPECDVVYMTRLQRERIDPDELKRLPASLRLDAQMLSRARVKKNMRILHPLPRVDEVAADVDDTPYAYYFEQANNGLYAREAMLSLALSDETV